MIIFPLPTLLLDFALAMNLTLSVLILALSVYVPHALHLSTFPTILLVTTLFRLGLNIASTRQILLNGYAGDIITTFGDLVVGGNVVVGLVIFIIIAIIQFIVIAKGSDRVAEVGARFSLDAMPGKQMAIDADLRAGIINKADALERRTQVEQASQFYGAMDGASKFVKGDAVAGILIALINVVGGILIGTAINGRPLAETAQLYTVLTIGDGLVSQIPSLLISFAAGILITRVASLDSASSVGADIGVQVTSQPKALYSAAVVAFCFAWIPGFPAIAFLSMGGACLAVALLIPRFRMTASGKAQLSQHWARRDGVSASVMHGDTGTTLPLRVAIDPTLLSSMNTAALDRALLACRDRFRESGVPYPGLRLVPDRTLEKNTFSIDIDEITITRDVIKHDNVQSSADSDNNVAEAGKISPRSFFRGATKGSADRNGAENRGSAEAQLKDYIEQAICSRPWQFLGIQEASYLQENLSRHFPELVQLMKASIPLPMFRDVLIELLKSGIHIRNLRAITEGLAGGLARPEDVEGLVAAARGSLASQISHMYCDEKKVLSIVVMAPVIEAFIRKKLVVSEAGKYIDIESDVQKTLTSALDEQMQAIKQTSPAAILVTGQDIRRSLEGLLHQDKCLMQVLAIEEMAEHIGYVVAGTISPDNIGIDWEN